MNNRNRTLALVALCAQRDCACGDCGAGPELYVAFSAAACICWWRRRGNRRRAAPAQQTPAAGPGSQAQPTGPRLTVADAEQMAIAQQPKHQRCALAGAGAGQVTREVRSAEMPTATGDLTAVGAHENSRITAGYLSNSSVLRSRRGRTYGKPADHRLRPHAQPGAQRSIECQGAA